MGEVKTVEELHKDLISKQERPVKNAQVVGLGDISSARASQGKMDFSEISPYSRETVYKSLSDGSEVAMFESYIPGTNNEERLAQRQSTGDKWTNGLLKLGGKTLTAVAGGTIGVVDSIFTGVKEGSISAAYSSDFNKWLDDLNTRMDYKLPNYYTEQEKNAGFMDSLGSTNFWANDFLGGLSFTIGAVVSEVMWAAATGGTSLLTGAGRWSSKLLGSVKSLKSLNTYKTLLKKPLTGAIEKTAVGLTDDVIKTGLQTSNIYKALNSGRFLLTSAGYESGVEARHYMKDTEEQWLRGLGREPSAEEYQTFKDNLSDTANAVFGANLLLVGSSNMATFGKLAMGKSISPTVSNSWFNRNVLGLGFNKTATGSFELVKATAKQKVAQKVYGLGKYAIIEGVYEEGGQAVASSSAKDFMLNGYDEEGTRNSYDLIDSVLQGFNKTYGTKEGRKEVGLGMLIGMFGGSVSSKLSGRGFTGNDSKRLEQQVDARNSFHAGMVVDRLKTNSKIQTANKKSEEAEKRGDLTGQYASDTEAQIASIERDYNFQGLEEGVNDFKSAMSAVENEDLASDLGIDISEVEQWKKEKIDSYENLSKEYDRNARYSEALLSSSNIAGLDAGKKADIQKAIAFNLTMGKKMDTYSQDVISSIKKFVVSDVVGKEVVGSISIDANLDRVSKEVVTEYNKLDREQKTLLDKQTQLQDKIYDTQNLANTEENTTRKNDLSSLSKQLLETEAKLQEIQGKKEAVVQTMNLENLSGDTLTVEALDSQKENLKKLKAHLDTIKLNDPQRHAIISKLVAEHNKAVKSAKSYNKTTQEIIDPNTRVTVLAGWLSALTKKNKGKVDADFFASAYENWVEMGLDLEVNNEEFTKQSFTDSQRALFREGEEVEDAYLKDLISQVKEGRELQGIDAEIFRQNEERIEELDVEEIIIPQEEAPTEKKGMTTLEAIRQKIKDIINSDKYLVQYFGEDVNSTKPTQEEIDEFNRLKGGEGSSLEDKKKAIKDKVDSLPDNLLFITHITSESNAINIYNSSLLMPAGVSSTTGIVDKEQLLNILYDLADGKSPHRGYLDMFIGGIDKTTLESTNGKTLQDKLENYLDDNYTEDVAKTQLPSDLNIGYFSDGKITTKYETSQNSQDRFKQLNKKFNDWKVLDGSRENPNDNSIAYWLELEQKLQTQVEERKTKLQLTDKEFNTLSNTEETTPLSIADTSSTISSPDNVVVYVDQKTGNYTFSHMNLQTLGRVFNGQLFSENNKSEKEKGAKFTLVTETGELKVEIGERGRLLIERGAFDSMVGNSQIRIFNTGINNTNSVFIKLDNGSFIPLEGDFGYSDANGEITYLNVELLNTIKKGDTLKTELNINDDYNQKLLTEYRAKIINKDELTQRVNIYVKTDGSNEIVGSLRAIEDYQKESPSEATQDNLSLRKLAVDKLLDKKNNQTVVDLNTPLEVKMNLLGTPNLEVSEKENGQLTAKTVPFTQSSIKQVKAKGYILNGEVFLDNEMKTNTTFVSKLSANQRDIKIPVIVFEKNGQNVVFPININRVKVSKASELDFIYSQELSGSEKANKVVDVMIQNNITPTKYNFDFTKTDWFVENEELDKLTEELDNIEEFITAEDLLSKNMLKESLITDAEIALDLDNNPLKAGKLVVKITPIVYQAEVEDGKLQVEKELSDLAIELNKDLVTNASITYTDSKGNIAEDNEYFRAFDESEIFKNPKSSTEVLRNIKVLRKAFSKPIPSIIQKAVTKEKIAQVRDLFKKLDKLKAKEKTAEIKNIEENPCI